MPLPCTTRSYIPSPLPVCPSFSNPPSHRLLFVKPLSGSPDRSFHLLALLRQPFECMSSTSSSERSGMATIALRPSPGLCSLRAVRLPRAPPGQGPQVHRDSVLEKPSETAEAAPSPPRSSSRCLWPSPGRPRTRPRRPGNHGGGPRALRGALGECRACPACSAAFRMIAVAVHTSPFPRGACEVCRRGPPALLHFHRD